MNWNSVYICFPIKIKTNTTVANDADVDMITVNKDVLLNFIEHEHKYTAQKNEVSIKDFFSKCEQIRRKLRICSHLLKKSLMEHFTFCAVNVVIRTLLLIVGFRF